MTIGSVRNYHDLRNIVVKRKDDIASLMPRSEMSYDRTRELVVQMLTPGTRAHALFSATLAVIAQELSERDRLARYKRSHAS